MRHCYDTRVATRAPPTRAARAASDLVAAAPGLPVTIPNHPLLRGRAGSTDARARAGSLLPTTARRQRAPPGPGANGSQRRRGERACAAAATPVQLPRPRKLPSPPPGATGAGARERTRRPPPPARCRRRCRPAGSRALCVRSSSPRVGLLLPRELCCAALLLTGQAQELASPRAPPVNPARAVEETTRHPPPPPACRPGKRTFNRPSASAPRGVLWGSMPRTVFQKMREGARQCHGPPRRGLELLFFCAASSHLSLLR
jgi:hypothetical protein